MARPNNASIGTATMNNRPLRERRGCELFPDRIDFGILKEGIFNLIQYSFIHISFFFDNLFRVEITFCQQDLKAIFLLLYRCYLCSRSRNQKCRH